MITAYLKVNIGILLALGINCYRKESESWDTFSQAVNLQSSCVSSGSTSGMVLSLPPVGGGAMENAFHLSPWVRSAGTSDGGHSHLLRKNNNISEIYIHSIFNEVRVFRLNSKMLWVLPFPHLQPLTLLSLPTTQPPSLFSHHASVRAHHSLERLWGAGGSACTQSLYAGRSKRSGPIWKLLRLAVVWGYRHLTFFADRVNV